MLFIENTELRRLIGCGIRLHLHYCMPAVFSTSTTGFSSSFLRNLVAVCGSTLPNYEESCNLFCRQIYKTLLHMCSAHTYLVFDRTP
jgi:hypothetical protein